jgi:hypothetical protein
LKTIAAVARQRQVYKPSRRGSGAARFFYKPSRRDSGSFSAAMDISEFNISINDRLFKIMAYGFGKR